MIKIDTNGWDEIEGMHQEWWMKHLESQDWGKIFDGLENDEKKFLLRLLNNFEEVSVEEGDVFNSFGDVKSKLGEEQLKKFIINSELDEKLKNLPREFEVPQYLTKKYKDLIKKLILKKESIEQIKRMDWKGHLKKARNKDQKEYIFYILKGSKLTEGEKNTIKSFKEKQEVVNFLEGLEIEVPMEEELKGHYHYTSIRDSLFDMGKYNGFIKKINSKKHEKKSKCSLFEYKSEFGDKEWNRHLLLSKMSLRVCPYCQRNYITSYKRSEKAEVDEKTTADLDHFYPKSIYPFLAFSLYNFIPSCQVCNSRFKSDKDTYGMEVVNPYDTSFDEIGVKFKSNSETLNSILDGSEKFEIGFENEEKVIGSIDILGLEKVYKTSHNIYIKDMLENFHKAPDSYIESITDEIFDSFCTRAKSAIKKGFKEGVEKPYKHRIEEGEPLGKLTKDILEEFGIEL